MLDTVTCESQGRVSSCRLGEISKSLPALSDHSSECPGQRTDHPTTGQKREGKNFLSLYVTHCL